MEFAVVVPTKSRAKEVRALLSCLSVSSIKPKAVIVVDSSDDELTQFACEESRLWGQGLVHYLRSAPGAGLQRNMGVSFAAELGLPYSALMDDDIRPEPDFFDNCIDLHRKSGPLSVVGGWDVGCNPSRYSRLRYLLGFSGPQVGFFVTRSGQAVYGNGSALEVQPVDWLPGGMMFSRTRDFLDHPYREDFLIYGDDLDLCLRLRSEGYKLITGRHLGVQHLSSLSGKESRWRNYLGYFRFRYWLSGQAYSGVHRLQVLSNATLSIPYNLFRGVFGNRDGISWAFGDAVGLAESAFGRSKPTPRRQPPQSGPSSA